MNRIFLILCIFALLTAANAGELYSCIDRDGNKIITDSPQDGMKCVSKESYEDLSPQERAQEQSEKLRKQRIASQEDQSKNTDDQEMNKRVVLEKRRLEENIEHFKNKASADSKNAASYRRQVEGYERWLQELNKDPEYYFYKKQERDKKVVLSIASDITESKETKNVEEKNRNKIPGIL